MTLAPPNRWVPPWPDGLPAPGAPRTAKWLAELAVRLQAHDRHLVAARTGLDRRTVDAAVDGLVWPDLRTTIALTTYLDAAGQLPSG
jgi:hypothetical protein